MIRYEDFPEVDYRIHGIKEINMDISEIGCTYIPDVIYINRDGMPLTLQIIVPYRFNSENKFPLMVFVQGSAWMKQDCYANLPMLARFALRGYAVAIVEYRHSGISPFPAQVQDAKTSIRFLRKNAVKYNINPDEIFIWGDSSGGHTALLAGLTCHDDILSTDDYNDFSCKVNGIIDFYGVTDITDENGFPSTPNHQKPDSPEGLLIGGKDVHANAELSQPTICMNYISSDKEIPPVLIIHGTKDRIVAFHQSVKLYEKLKSCGKIVDFYALRCADHGGPAFWTEGVLDIVETFVKAYQ